MYMVITALINDTVRRILSLTQINLSFNFNLLQKQNKNVELQNDKPWTGYNTHDKTQNRRVKKLSLLEAAYVEKCNSIPNKTLARRHKHFFSGVKTLLNEEESN